MSSIDGGNDPRKGRPTIEFFSSSDDDEEEMEEGEIRDDDKGTDGRPSEDDEADADDVRGRDRRAGSNVGGPRAWAAVKEEKDFATRDEDGDAAADGGDSGRRRRRSRAEGDDGPPAPGAASASSSDGGAAIPSGGGRSGDDDRGGGGGDAREESRRDGGGAGADPGARAAVKEEGDEERGVAAGGVAQEDDDARRSRTEEDDDGGGSPARDPAFASMGAGSSAAVAAAAAGRGGSAENAWDGGPSKGKGGCSSGARAAAKEEEGTPRGDGDEQWSGIADSKASDRGAGFLSLEGGSADRTGRGSIISDEWGKARCDGDKGDNSRMRAPTGKKRAMQGTAADAGGLDSGYDNVEKSGTKDNKTPSWGAASVPLDRSSAVASGQETTAGLEDTITPGKNSLRPGNPIIGLQANDGDTNNVQRHYPQQNDKQRPKLHRFLYSMSKGRNFPDEKIIERIKRKKYWRGLSDQDEPHPEIEFVDDCARLPIHIACQNITRTSFEIVKTLVTGYPEGLQKRSLGDLPLHMACHPMCQWGEDMKEVSVPLRSEIEKTICLLAEQYPLSILMENAQGSTALHSLLEHRPSLQLVRHMVELSEDVRNKLLEDLVTPSGAPAVTFPIRTPLIERKDSEQQLLLHVAIERNAGSNVIQYLVDLYPDAARSPGPLGYLPLHSATQWGCTSTVLDRLLSGHDVSAVAEKNDDKETPLHLLFSTKLNTERWVDYTVENHQDVALPDGSKVISGPPPDLLSPKKMLKMILNSYYFFLRNPPSHPVMPRKKKKKKGNRLTHKQAMQRVRSLLKSNRNAEKMSILDLARSCKSIACAAKFPDEFLEYVDNVACGQVELDEDEDGSESESNVGRNPAGQIVATYSGAVPDHSQTSAASSSRTGIQNERGLGFGLSGHTTSNQSAPSLAWLSGGATIQSHAINENKSGEAGVEYQRSSSATKREKRDAASYNYEERETKLAFDGGLGPPSDSDHHSSRKRKKMGHNSFDGGRNDSGTVESLFENSLLGGKDVYGHSDRLGAEAASGKESENREAFNSSDDEHDLPPPQYPQGGRQAQTRRRGKRDGVGLPGSSDFVKA